MRKRDYGAWTEPDLTHADLSHAAEAEAYQADPDSRPSSGPSVLPSGDVGVVSDDLGHRRRSIIPDPLTILIAAESGKPILVPIFPLAAFGPETPCPHKGPIPDGSPHYCPSCHDTGLRDHPLLQLSEADIPLPDKVAADAVPAKVIRPDPPASDALTRRQRRALEFSNQGTADARPDGPALAAG